MTALSQQGFKQH